LIRFGYCSGNERKCSPQVNLILGVNNQHVPLFANTYPGNTQDVKMFEDFIDQISIRYHKLTSHIKEKFVIFDQGNVNPGKHRFSAGTSKARNLFRYYG